MNTAGSKAPSASSGDSADSRPDQQHGPRSGDLTLSWRVLLGLTWFTAFFAYAALWQASVQIGIATWWIGPRAQPQPAVIRILPFALALTMSLFAIYNVRRLVHASIAGSVLAAAIAVPDLSRSTGLAIAEFVVAALLMIVSVASLTGRYRLAATSGSAPDSESVSGSVSGSTITNCWPPPPPAG